MSLYFQRELDRIFSRLHPHSDLTVRIVSAQQWLRSQTDREVTVEELAGRASLSRFHFIRQFQKIYGMPPRQYHLHIRMTEARRLLTAGVSVADTAERVGFQSVPSFYKRFKDFSGTTPSAWRSRKTQTSSIPVISVLRNFG